MLAVLLMLSPPPAVTAPAPEPAPAEEKEEKPALAFAFGDVWLTPILGPSYTPEMGFTLAAGGMVSWKSDKGSPRSNITATVSYGTVGAGQGYFKLTGYFLHDTLRIETELGAKYMNDHFFGVGYEEGSTTPLGDETSKYQRGWFSVRPQVLAKVAADFFVGGAIDFNGTNATELNPLMAAHPMVVEQGTKFLNFGFGPIVQYDTRDFPQNAYRGIFLQGKIVYSLRGLGSQESYGLIDLDYRQYKPLGRPGKTLAWRVQFRNAGGETPWTELPSMGSSNDLRGYRGGQYRDDSFLYGVIEYRHMFTAGRGPTGAPRLSKHGFAAWVGAGVMGAGGSEISPPLPTLGIGYRFAAQNRMNVRIDYGTGRFEAQGVYVSFGEAF